jgi:hypothetical protein
MINDMLCVMKTNQEKNPKDTADDIFADFREGDSKGVFARIPSQLHSQILEIKDETGKSIYEIVEKALKLFVSEYNSRIRKDKQ